jgi:hypothetical protein
MGQAIRTMAVLHCMILCRRPHAHTHHHQHYVAAAGPSRALSPAAGSPPPPSPANTSLTHSLKTLRNTVRAFGIHPLGVVSAAAGLLLPTDVILSPLSMGPPNGVALA